MPLIRLINCRIMKHSFYFLFVFILIFTSAKAQKPITLTPDSAKIGNSRVPGFSVTIPEIKPEALKASWIKTIEKGTKSKAVVENNDITVFGAVIPNYDGGAVNIMSKATDRDSLCSLFVSFETKPDVYISKDSPEYDRLSKFLKKFAKDQYIVVAKNQLTAENDKLSELEKQLKSERKSTDKFRKNIQSAEVSIEAERDKISSYEKEIEVTNSSIESSSSVISSMDEGDGKKAKKSELKKLENKKKGLLKSINSSENKISKANTAIEDNNSNIVLKEATLKDLNERIVQQKLVVTRFETKLNTIENY
jgi:cytochrome oxidase Cu insertion factor (SCO1/SenC/PrrC family)